MGSSWILKLAFSCIDHCAWPLLALGYPLYASVQAIKTDSYSETRDLISYWILLSLIYLFEYALMSLLSWFQFWPYMKLMIVFWLIIPDFGRASYVYSNFIHSCISMKPQAVISKLKTWRELFAKKENFLLHVERYVQENGTEALEKLIASKITTQNPDAEATNTIRAIDEKEKQQVRTGNPDAEATNTATFSTLVFGAFSGEIIPSHEGSGPRAADKKEMQQAYGKKLQTEHKDIKDLEIIEKKEIFVGKQDTPVMPDLSLAVKETDGMAPGKDAAGGELPQSSARKEVQKEWTCAVCQVTTASETDLNSHLHGRKHKAACEALNAKDQSVPRKLKNDQSKDDLKQQQKNVNQLANVKQRYVPRFRREREHAQTSGEPEKSMLNDLLYRTNPRPSHSRPHTYPPPVGMVAPWPNMYYPASYTPNTIPCPRPSGHYHFLHNPAKMN